MANIQNKTKLNVNNIDSLPPLPIAKPTPIINVDGTIEYPSNNIQPQINTKNVVSNNLDAQNSDNVTRDDLERIYATMQMQQALKGIERTAEEEELKQQNIANILNRLQTPIEMPQRKTIADILNGGNFGERLETFAQYAEQPQFQRNLGNAIGTRLFNKSTGRFENTGERLNREREAFLNAEQLKALEEQKLQDALSKDLFSSMNALDRENLVNERELQRMIQSDRHFNDSLKAQMENSNRNLDIQNRKIDATLAGIEADKEYRKAQDEYKRLQDLKSEAQQAFKNDLELQKLELEKFKAGEIGNNVKITAEDKKQLTNNKQTLANIEAGLKAIEKHPNAYRLGHVILPAAALNAYSSYTGKKGDIETRAQIDNITAVYRKWLTGAQMSDRERKDYERFLPAKGDNAQIVKSKLNAMKDSIERSNQAIMNNYEQNNNSLNVDYDEIEKEMKRRGL